MAAAYAALVSLWHVIDQIEHHPRPPISLHKSQVQSLLDNITFLQEFLEGYDGSKVANHYHHHILESRITDAAYAAEDIIESHIVHQIEGYGVSKEKPEHRHVLESRIADAAYAAEDIIESRVVNQILARSKPRSVKISKNQGLEIVIREMEMIESHVVHQIQAHAPTTTNVKKIRGSIDFYQDLQKVIQEMDLIKTVATKIKEKTKVQDRQHRISTSAASLKSHPKGKNTMVGLDDVKTDLMDKLTGRQSRRQIIPIVGMGGIGKTTLATNIYEDPLIKHHFDILAWTTISQEHNAKEILLQILVCMKTSGSRETLSHMSEHELGEKLHKSLIGRRYLIVMDDIWSIESWDRVRLFSPDNGNGSRIIITTRLSNLAFELTGSNGIKMDFLDEDKSWDLLRKIVDCPLELEEIGKKIAKNCKGLPLSIVVIGGLLAKSKGTREHWEYIEENLNSFVKSEDNARCSKILQMSYNHLPIHLKPCFLYMGVYGEDCPIYVPQHMKLWIAEGFLKPISGKSLEEVAEEYFNDLVDRNLVLVSRRKYNGKIRAFKIHDLLMDLCVRESRRGKFLYLTRQHKLNDVSQDISTQRRIVVQEGTTPEIIDALPCASLVRSLTRRYKERFPELFSYSLLRVWNGFALDSNGWHSLGSACGLVNCRYLNSIRIEKSPKPGFPSPFSLFWNLPTLVVSHSGENTLIPSEFWKMSQIRHVKLVRLRFLDPPPSGGDDDEFVLTNLQTLKGMVPNFKCSEEKVKRIPNIKKLELEYDRLEEWESSNFNNLGRLHKLESLDCSIFGAMSWKNNIVPFVGSEFLRSLTFPQSLRKLTLYGMGLNLLQWEDVTTKISLLPHLQVLKLNDSVKGPEWETVEGHFCSLKYLLIYNCWDLENWTTESAHFPCLEHIVLCNLGRLKEIPLDIGEIPTLKSIELIRCSESSIISAKEIVNEQEALGNEGLQVRVQLPKKNKALERGDSLVIRQRTTR